MKKKPLLAVHNLSIKGPRSLLSRGNFSLYPKEIVMLTGENGIGKTTIALSIIGLLEKSLWKVGGDILFREETLLNLDERKWETLRGKDIGFVFQDPIRSFNPLKTIESHFIEAMIFHEGVVECSKIEALLIAVGLMPAEQYLKAYPFQLSGGEAQRIAIALALVHDPSLLVLDEPTSALDQKGCDDIMRLIKTHQHQKDMTVLAISHDGSFIKSHADRVLTMAQQKIELTQKAALGLPEENQIRKRACVQNKPLLKISNMCVKRGEQTILSGVDLSLHPKEIIGIFGDNGCGKTTFAKALVELLPFDGTVRGPNIQMVFQNPLSSFNPKMTIFEAVLEGVDLRFPSLSLQEKKAKAVSILQDVRLGSRYHERFPETLSGGEIQRAAIARALVMEGGCLILDEPTTSLDQESFVSIVHLIRKLHDHKEVSFLIISHQKDLLKALCHRVFEIKKGKVISVDALSFNKS